MRLGRRSKVFLDPQLDSTTTVITIMIAMLITILISILITTLVSILIAILVAILPRLVTILIVLMMKLSVAPLLTSKSLDPFAWQRSAKVAAEALTGSGTQSAVLERN